MKRSRRRTPALLAVSGLALAACGGPGAARQEITVLAAASLTESFAALAEGFERAHPDTRVVLSFGASSTLAAQILQGAPADVFAAANEATMQRVSEAGRAPGPVPIATNTLQIAVPAGNPGGITGLADFADARRRIALCAPEVPCGEAAERVFAAAGVTPRPDTVESDAKATLEKVKLDEVDAALVYRTDVRVAGDVVDGVDFPQATEAVNAYPLAVLTEARNPDGARVFVDYVRGPAGRDVLAEAGFGPP